MLFFLILFLVVPIKSQNERDVIAYYSATYEDPVTGCGSNKEQIGTWEECQEAALVRGVHFWGSADGQSSSDPPGCIYRTSDNDIYFNAHPTGSTSRTDRQLVCVWENGAEMYSTTFPEDFGELPLEFREKSVIIHVETTVPDAEGCLFEAGGTGYGTWLGLVDRAGVLYWRLQSFRSTDGADTSGDETAVIMYPKGNSDGNVKSITATIDIPTHTITLCIDSQLFTASSSSVPEYQYWAGINPAGFGENSSYVANGGIAEPWQGTPNGILGITSCPGNSCTDAPRCIEITTSSPTSSPTLAPTTPSPTASPTPTPTTSPTTSPTPTPTTSPTPSPTKGPLATLTDMLNDLINDANVEIEGINENIQRASDTVALANKTVVEAENAAALAHEKMGAQENNCSSIRGGCDAHCEEMSNSVPRLEDEIELFEQVIVLLEGLSNGEELVEEDQKKVSAFISMSDQANVTKIQDVIALVQGLIDSAGDEIAQLNTTCTECNTEHSECMDYYSELFGVWYAAESFRITVILELVKAQAELTTAETHANDRTPQLEKEILDLEEAVELLQSLV